MHFIEYNRDKAVNYARRWAFSRNPDYFDFSEIGGDCTNFASQCLFAGIGVMNFTKDIGWYYISPANRAAAWSSAEHFKRFMLTNRGEGPFASAVPINQLERGDFICLNNGMECYHTLIVVGIKNTHPLVAAHSRDAFGIPLSSYSYEEAKGVHILGGNVY